MLAKWFQRLCGESQSKRGPRRPGRRRTSLKLEQLEVRLVPVAFTFTWRGAHTTLWSAPDNGVENRVSFRSDPVCK